MPDWNRIAAAPPRNGATWVGFMVATFLVVGLVGLFATYAAPLTYQRELRQQAVLDTVAQTPPADRAGLRDALGDSADTVLNGTAPIDQRVAAARIGMQARFAAEAEQTGQRLRLLIIVVTMTGALFGAILMRLHRRD